MAKVAGEELGRQRPNNTDSCTIRMERTTHLGLARIHWNTMGVRAMARVCELAGPSGGVSLPSESPLWKESCVTWF